MLGRIINNSYVQGIVAILVMILLLVLILVTVSSRKSPQVIKVGGGGVHVGDVHIESPGATYDDSVKAWVVPLEDLGVAEYRAYFYDLEVLSQNGDIVFTFLPSNVLCDDYSRVSRGGDAKDRVIYRGQITESVISRGGEVIGQNCPVSITHEMRVVIRQNDEVIGSDTVNFCIDKCYVEPTPTPTPVPTATPTPVPTATPTPTPFPPPENADVFRNLPVTGYSQCSCEDPDAVTVEKEDTFALPNNYRVCEDGHCYTDHYAYTPIHICGIDSEDGYMIRWAHVGGDNAAFTIPDVEYLQRYEGEMGSGQVYRIPIPVNSHPATGWPVVVDYDKYNNEVVILVGAYTYKIDVNHNVTMHH